MTESLQARARRINEARIVRAWEYRQRHHSKGVWFRIRRALVDAEHLWTIDGEEADRLEAKGFQVLPMGKGLFPPKRMFVIPASQLSGVALAQKIPVRIGAEFLATRDLVLVPFEDEATADALMCHTLPM